MFEGVDDCERLGDSVAVSVREGRLETLFAPLATGFFELDVDRVGAAVVVTEREPLTLDAVAIVDGDDERVALEDTDIGIDPREDLDAKPLLETVRVVFEERDGAGELEDVFDFKEDGDEPFEATTLIVRTEDGEGTAEGTIAPTAKSRANNAAAAPSSSLSSNRGSGATVRAISNTYNKNELKRRVMAIKACAR